MSDFSLLFTNLAERLVFTPPNSVPSERAFSCLKLQYFRLRISLSLAKLDLFCFFYMNRRVLDRAIMGYKRNIYDLTPTEEMEEEENIFDLKIEEERGSIINGNEKVIKATEATEDFISDGRPTKRRRGSSDEAPV
jgi:hypothetical protein